MLPPSQAFRLKKVLHLVKAQDYVARRSNHWGSPLARIGPQGWESDREGAGPAPRPRLAKGIKRVRMIPYGGAGSASVVT